MLLSIFPTLNIPTLFSLTTISVVAKSFFNNYYLHSIKLKGASKLDTCSHLYFNTYF